ncbi:glycosyltransferase [Acidobacteria bacterium AB60]|nr:glycosyltransferase [Acidobacteria bacterium AB60]
MKRLLILTPRFPYPAIGGDRLRIDRICRELAQHFSLTLASLCDDPAEMHLPPPNGLFARVERVYLPRWRSVLNCVGGLVGSVPLQIAYYRSTRFAQMVERLLPHHDGVLCHLIRTAEYARRSSIPIPRFLEMTDAISMNYSRVRKEVGGDWVKKMIYRVEQSRLQRYEKAIGAEFDCSFLVSSVDMDYLAKDFHRASPRYRIAGNGVDHQMFPFQFANFGTRICFIGNMTTLQNLDAAIHFASEVFPFVLSEIPDARFQIIGRIKHNDRRFFQGFESVHVTGEVHSVADAAKGAVVGVCPMRVAAGLQNKILEYMALGVPAVVTSMGLEGLTARNGTDLLVADTPEAFAAAVVRLIKDRVWAKRIADSARQYVEQEHSWPKVLAPLCDTLCRRTGMSAVAQEVSNRGA